MGKKNLEGQIDLFSLIDSISVTDDDIEVVEQWAMWYFTNGNNNGYSSEYAEINPSPKIYLSL